MRSVTSMFRLCLFLAARSTRDVTGNTAPLFVRDLKSRIRLAGAKKIPSEQCRKAQAARERSLSQSVTAGRLMVTLDGVSSRVTTRYPGNSNVGHSPPDICQPPYLILTIT